MLSKQTRDVEIARLVGQYLCENGLRDVYQKLKMESGISIESTAVSTLREGIMSGNWSDAETSLDALSSIIDDASKVSEARFLLLEQQFLELAEANDPMGALSLLRNRITPIKPDCDRLNVLTRCLMCRTGEEVRSEAGGWSGVEGCSRSDLIEKLEHIFSAQAMIPRKRLNSLIAEAVLSEVKACQFHNRSLSHPDTFNSISILQPHFCYIEEFPVFPAQVIDHRDTELYFCQFSPNGLRLATGGRAVNIDVWQVDIQLHTVRFWLTLTTHKSPVSHLCWSPDSKKIAVCFGENRGAIMVYDVETERVLCTRSATEEEIYSTSAFFSDSRKLAFGGMEGVFYVIDTEEEGRILVAVEGYRIESMAAILSQSTISEIDEFTTSAIMDINSEVKNPPHRSEIKKHDDSKKSDDSSLLLEATNSQSLTKFDELLVADNLNRIRLFKFGYKKESIISLPIRENDSPVQFIADIIAEARNINSPSVAETSVSTSGRPQDTSAYMRYLLSLRPITIDSTAGRRQHYAHSSSVEEPRMGRNRSLVPPAAHTGYQISSTRGSSVLSSSPFYSLGGVDGHVSVFSVVEDDALTGISSRSGMVSRVIQSYPSRISVASTTTTFIAEEENSNSVELFGPVNSADSFRQHPAIIENSSATSGQTYGLIKHRTLIREIQPIQSISMSPSGNRLLVTLYQAGIHLWDLQSRALVQRFSGFRQSTHRLTSSIGGIKEDFVATGSEDGHLHIWSAFCDTHPINSSMAASGHYAVNCAHWNPAFSTLLATVNDSGELRIWAPAKFSLNHVKPVPLQKY